MMISDSGIDSGSSPEIHSSSMEETPMSRTHQYRKVRQKDESKSHFKQDLTILFTVSIAGHETFAGTKTEGENQQMPGRPQRHHGIGFAVRRRVDNQSRKG